MVWGKKVTGQKQQDKRVFNWFNLWAIYYSMTGHEALVGYPSGIRNSKTSPASGLQQSVWRQQELNEFLNNFYEPGAKEQRRDWSSSSSSSSSSKVYIYRTKNIGATTVTCLNISFIAAFILFYRTRNDILNMWQNQYKSNIKHNAAEESSPGGLFCRFLRNNSEF